MENIKKMSLELNIEYIKQSDKNNFDHNDYFKKDICLLEEYLKNQISYYNYPFRSNSKTKFNIFTGNFLFRTSFIHKSLCFFLLRTE